MKIRMMKSFDKIFGALLVKFMTGRTTDMNYSPNSILVIRPGGIGDAVLLIPAINAISENYPNVAIAVLSEKRNAAAFKLCPHVKEILQYEKPKQLLGAIRGNYDVVIDTEQWHLLSAVVARLTGASISIGYATNDRKRMFTHSVPYEHGDYEIDSFTRLLEPLGVIEPIGIKSPFLVVPDQARKKSELLLGDLVKKRFIVIFPGASIPERRWGVDKFRAVAARLSNEGFAVVVVGASGDEADGNRILDRKYGLNLAGKCSLTETAAVIDRGAVLLSGDSGVLHIGVGLDKPTVSLFGPGIAKKWAPKGVRHIVINKNLQCSPCTRFGYTPKCPINAKCLADISVDEVSEAILRLIKIAVSH